MQVQPTPIEEMAEAHTVPDKLKDLPFIELAMFLHYKLDGVPPGELEPEMLSACSEGTCYLGRTASDDEADIQCGFKA